MWRASPGLLEGLRFVRRRGVENIAAQESLLIRRLGEEMEEIPGARVFLAREPGRQAGVLSFQMEGWDCETLGEALGERGFALRAGLHCAPLAHESAGTPGPGDPSGQPVRVQHPPGGGAAAPHPPEPGERRKKEALKLRWEISPACPSSCFPGGKRGEASVWREFSAGGGASGAVRQKK